MCARWQCATVTGIVLFFWAFRSWRSGAKLAYGSPSMNFHGYLARIAAPVLIIGLVGACEPKTLASNAEPGQDSGTSSTEGGSACVDIDVAPADISCGSDSDCVLTLTGHVCDRECNCGDTPVNAGAAARYRSETASLTFEGCPCADPGEARCLGGQCALCGLGPNQPAGCGEGTTVVEDSGVGTADEESGLGTVVEDGGVGTADEDGGLGTVVEDSGVGTTDEDSGLETVVEGAPDAGVSRADGSSCVDVEVGPSDHSCGSDQDCTLARTGEVCSGQCSCGDTAVNATASARFQSETASLTLKACPCAFAGEARCVGGQCTLCGLGPGVAAGCNDTGTTVGDSGVGTVDGSGPDTGISTADGGQCVEIDLSTYDQSCRQTADCILIQAGEVCSGQCTCGGQPVSVSEHSRYEQATSGIAFGICFCPAQAAPQCVDNRCILPVVLHP